MLSIVTVNFNNDRGLQNTIDSLLNQNTKDFEWVFVDGLSSDNSLSIFDTNKKLFKNLKYLAEEDCGIYDAMNKGISISTGSHILFLNSGDFFSHFDSVSNILKSINLHPSSTLLFGFKYKGIFRPPHYPIWCLWKMPTSHQAMIFPKTIFNNLKYNLRYIRCADYELFVRLYKGKNDFKRISKCLVENEVYNAENYKQLICEEYSTITKEFFPYLSPFIPYLRCLYDNKRTY